MIAFNEIHAPQDTGNNRLSFQAGKQQEAPAKKKPLTPEERAKIIEKILDDLEALGIIPPKVDAMKTY